MERNEEAILRKEIIYMFDFLFKSKKITTGGVFVVFDIGGTKMRVAVALGDMLTEVRVEYTPQDPVEGLSKLRSLIEDVAAGQKIAGVVGCIAGWVDENGEVSGTRNLPQWIGSKVISQLSEALGVSVSVFNDCELIGLGEYKKVSGAKRLAYITVSTGVGGALIVDGKMASSDPFLEVGRIPSGDSDLEGMISGSAIQKRFGVDPRNLSSIDERNNLADLLAQGLVSVVGAWLPDTIVLGGSMMVGAENTIPTERVQMKLAELLSHSAQMPKIQKATLGDLGGLYGALAYLKQIQKE